jgi:hypothetical protein
MSGSEDPARRHRSRHHGHGHDDGQYQGDGHDETDEEGKPWTEHSLSLWGAARRSRDGHGSSLEGD